MASMAGQAAGMAVGAAVGSLVGQPIAGAAIGAAGVGYLQQTGAGKIQGELEQQALALNREQARLKASEASSIHAANFRQKLASQVSMAAMRGGSGSIVSQFSHQAYGTFLRDQKAIQAGLAVSEAQAGMAQAGLSATQTTRDITAATNFITHAFEGINLNEMLKAKKG